MHFTQFLPLNEMFSSTVDYTTPNKFHWCNDTFTDVFLMVLIAKKISQRNSKCRISVCTRYTRKQKEFVFSLTRFIIFSIRSSSDYLACRADRVEADVNAGRLAAAAAVSQWWTTRTTWLTFVTTATTCLLAHAARLHQQPPPLSADVSAIKTDSQTDCLSYCN